MSRRLTSGVVTRKRRFAALIGRLVRRALGVRVVRGFVGFLVLDENFAHQLLRTRQGDAGLQLQTDTGVVIYPSNT